MPWFSLAFLLFVFLEFYVASIVSSYIGVLGVLGLFILGAAAGVSLLKHQRNLALQMFSGAGGAPNPVGLIAQFAGAILLIFPGFITDMLGLLLLLPVSRSIFASRAGQKLVNEGMSGTGSFGRSVFWVYGNQATGQNFSRQSGWVNGQNYGQDKREEIEVNAYYPDENQQDSPTNTSSYGESYQPPRKISAKDVTISDVEPDRTAQADKKPENKPEE